MAIRFQCGACSQPIEVDDEWASKAVACPYCRKTITAPAESTIDDLARIPMAAPAGPPHAPPPFAPSPGLAVGTMAPPPSGNTVAVVALVLALATLALIAGSQLLLSGHQMEFQALMETVNAAPNFAARMEAQQKYLEQNPTFLNWFVPVCLLVLISGLTWIAAVICGVIGIRRPVRRGLATGALVIVAVVPFVFCCGGMLTGSG